MRVSRKPDRCARSPTWCRTSSPLINDTLPTRDLPAAREPSSRSASAGHEIRRRVLGRGDHPTGSTQSRFVVRVLQTIPRIVQRAAYSPRPTPPSSSHAQRHRCQEARATRLLFPHARRGHHRSPEGIPDTSALATKADLKDLELRLYKYFAAASSSLMDLEPPALTVALMQLLN